nr:polyprotein [Liposcelis bostrychophila iflavirus]
MTHELQEEIRELEKKVKELKLAVRERNPEISGEVRQDGDGQGPVLGFGDSRGTWNERILEAKRRYLQRDFEESMESSNVIPRVNSWINWVWPRSIVTFTSEDNDGAEKKFTVVYGVKRSEADLIYAGVGVARNLQTARLLASKDCMHQVYNGVEMTLFSVLRRCTRTVAQIDDGHQTQESRCKDGPQGAENQESDKANNTIVTRDQAEVTSNVHAEEEMTKYIENLSSTEPVVSHQPIVNRWMPMEDVKISVTDVDIGLSKRVWYIPRDLYAKRYCAPNLIPFSVYALGKYDIEFKFVVNGNKFSTGKVIASCRLDSYQSDETAQNIQGFLSRPHVILDLATNNEGNLVVPFAFRRNMIRNVSQGDIARGVKNAKYATVCLSILSPLRAGPDQVTEVSIRPFFRILKSHFTAMSYRVDLTPTRPTAQIASLETITEESGRPFAQVGEGLLPTVVKTLENVLIQDGKSNNQDKPTAVNKRMVIVPQPVTHFSTGKGFSDAVPLRLNPYGLTSFRSCVPIYQYRKTTDIARIWGLRETFVWNMQQTSGAELTTINIDPTGRGLSIYSGSPTPLEVMTGLYQLWSGTIELRFDCVSNAFHSGSFIICAEFIRFSGTSECETFASYTKTFHLGEQKSVTFEVPYIFDTTYRRTTSVPYFPMALATTAEIETATEQKYRKRQTGIMPKVKARVVVRVINGLVPIKNVTQEIDVLVYWRAGKNFSLHGLKQSNILFPNRSGSDNQPNSFPLSSAYTPAPEKAVVTAERTKRAVTDEDDGEPAPQELETFKERISKNVKPQEMERPQAQIETGKADSEKDDRDPTHNFSPGIIRTTALSSDVQTDIYDILRRPVLLARSVLVESLLDSERNGHFLCVPLQVPTWNMNVPAADNIPDYNFYHPGVSQTPTAVILSLFRHWRGSLRFTIIVRSVEGDARPDDSWEPVYVSHLPHSGVRMIGSAVWGKGDALPNFTGRGAPNTSVLACDPASFGCATEVIIPQINPVLTVEVPYSSENTWTLTWEDHPTKEYLYRDKGDTNAGHLAISCMRPRRVDIWFSVADDFELSTFNGIPIGESTQQKLVYNDNEGMVSVLVENEDLQPNTSQKPKENIRNLRKKRSEIPMAQIMEGFRPREFVTSVANSALASLTNPVVVCRSLMASVPIVGLPLAISDTSVQMHLELKNALRHLDQLVGTSTDSLNVVLAQLSGILNAIGEILRPTISFLGILDKLSDILVALVCKDWYLTAWHIGKMLIQYFNIGVQSVAQYLPKLINAVKEWFLPHAQDDSTATLAGVICGLVGTVMGCASLDINAFCKRFGARVTSVQGMSYFNQCILFCNRVFTMLYESVIYYLGLNNEIGLLAKCLVGKEKEIRAFITEAQVLMAEVNKNALSQPSLRLRVWANYLVALQLQKALGAVTNTRAYPVLNRVCTDYIKFCNDNKVDITSNPVRYEPFVVAIGGKPGIGKSAFIEDLVHDLLAQANLPYPYSENIYFRQNGATFWDGYRDQPVVVFDDFLNLNNQEQMVLALSDLYALKSTSLFIPNMAHLEEKGIRANPVLVILLMNDLYPTSLSSVAPTTEAVYRRRDLVFEVRLKPGANMDEIKKRPITGFDHLSFYRYGKNTDKNSLRASDADYPVFKDFLISQFLNYHSREKENVKMRYKRLFSRVRSASPNLSDPMAVLYDVNFEPSMFQNPVLPSEMISMQARRLLGQMDWDNLGDLVSPQDGDLETDLLGIEPPPPQNWLHMLISWSHSLVAISRAGARATASLSRKLLDCFKRVQGMCSVCDDVGYISVVCAETRNHPEARHFVCVDCHRGILRAGPDRCPVCRCDNMIPYMRNDVGVSAAFVKILTWMAHGFETMDTVLYEIFKPRCGMLSLDKIILWMYQLAIIYRAPVTRSGVYHMSNLFDSISDVYVAQSINIFAQSDWDPEPSTSQEQTNVDIEFPVIVDEELFEDMCSNFEPSRFNECKHNILRDKYMEVSYFKSEWRVIVGACEIMVSIHPCSTECYLLENKGWYHNFCSLFTDHNADFIRRRALDISLHGSNDNINYIPPFALPSWCKIIQKEDIQAVCSESWYNYLTSEPLKLVLGALASGGAILGLVTWFLKSRHEVEPEEVTKVESDGTGDETNVARLVRGRLLRKGRLVSKAFRRAKAQDASSFSDGICAKVRANMVILQATTLAGKEILMGAFMVGGRLALIPRHYMSTLATAKDGSVIFRMGPDFTDERHISVDGVEFLESDNKDYMVMKLPKSVPCFSRCNHLFNNEEAPDLPEFGILLIMDATQGSIEERRVVLGEIVPELNIEYEDQLFSSASLVEYNFSRKGACGSILVIPNSPHPILAMHTSGTTSGRGYGTLILKDEIECVVKEFGGDVACPEPVRAQLDSCDAASLGIRSAVIELGAVTRSQAVFIPSKSSILENPMREFLDWEPSTEPAILSPKDKRYKHKYSPLQYGIEKHGKLTKDFPLYLVEQAVDALWESKYQWIKPLCDVPFRRKLSPEEAVLGSYKWKYYDHLDLSTSAGWPWSVLRNGGKSAWISVTYGPDGEYSSVSIDKELGAVLLEKEKERKLGKVPFTVFCDMLKDERRKPEKVRKKGGTRVFCMCPLDYSIAMRQNYLHYFAAFMNNWVELGHAVGCNPYSADWDIIVLDLLAFGDGNIIEIDYSNFGPGLNAVVMAGAVEMAKRWTLRYIDDVDSTELEMLNEEVVNSLHIALDLVYRQTSGGPSGNNGTTPFNTTADDIILEITFWLLAPKTVMDPSALRRQNTRSRTYGDDALMAVHPDIQSWYNPRAVTDVLASFGVIVTDASNKEQEPRFKKLKEVRFLKRAFVPHPYVPTRFLAPLPIEIVRDTALWIRKGKSRMRILETAYATILNAWCFGPVIFEKFKKDINFALHSLGLDIITLDWDYLDMKFQEEDWGVFALSGGMSPQNEVVNF